MILAPMKCKEDVEEQVLDENHRPVCAEDGSPVKEKVTREFQTFRPVYVFDVSQTVGEPIASLATELEENVDSFELLRNTLENITPVPVTYEAIEGRVNGYFSPSSQKIVVKESLPQLQMIKTMIHEIAHATLGYGSKDDKWDRETKEVQAESVAYRVTQMLC